MGMKRLRRTAREPVAHERPVQLRRGSVESASHLEHKATSNTKLSWTSNTSGATLELSRLIIGTGIESLKNKRSPASRSHRVLVHSIFFGDYSSVFLSVGRQILITILLGRVVMSSRRSEKLRNPRKCA